VIGHRSPFHIIWPRQGYEMPVHPNHLTLRLLLFAAAGVLLVPLGSSHQAQMQSPERPASLCGQRAMPDGSPLDTPAVVNLNTFSGTAAGIGVSVAARPSLQISLPQATRWRSLPPVIGG